MRQRVPYDWTGETIRRQEKRRKFARIVVFAALLCVLGTVGLIQFLKTFTDVDWTNWVSIIRIR